MFDSPAEQTAWQHAEPAQTEGLAVPVAEGVSVVQVQLTISSTLQENRIQVQIGSNVCSR